MKYYIITLLGTYGSRDLHLFCSLYYENGEEYSWQIGYENVIAFSRKKDAMKFIEDVSVIGVLKVEKVFLKGVAHHLFNPRFKWKQSQ